MQCNGAKYIPALCGIILLLLYKLQTTMSQESDWIRQGEHPDMTGQGAGDPILCPECDEGLITLVSLSYLL